MKDMCNFNVKVGIIHLRNKILNTKYKNKKVRIIDDEFL